MSRTSLAAALLTMSLVTLNEAQCASDKKRKPLPSPTATATPSPSASPTATATPTPLPTQNISLLFSKGLDKPLPNYEPPTANTLALAGSRGESLFALLKVQSESCFGLHWGLLQNINNSADTQTSQIKMYSLPKHYFSQTSISTMPAGDYYDSMVPLNPITANEFQICPQSQNEWFVIETLVPTQSAGGNYAGTIAINNQMATTYSLEIWKMLWQRPNEMRVHSSLISWFNLLAHYGGYNSDEANLQNKYVNAMRENGFTPTFAWIATPPILQNSNGDWFYDYAGYPKASSSYQELVLKKEPTGWVQLPIPSLDKIEADPVKTLTALENTIKIWNLAGRAYVYLMDEIHSSDYPRLHRLSSLFHQYAPSAKILVTTKYVPEIENDIDIFVVLAEFWDSPGNPEPAVYENLKQKGKDVWLYVSCMSHGCSNSVDSGTPDYVIDRSSAYLRNIGTMMAKYHISEFLYWRMNHAYTNTAPMVADPWVTQWDFDGQGDGNMMYPMKPGMFDYSTHEPGISLRMKLTQEYLNDRIYHHWMGQSANVPMWWQSEINKLVTNTRDWSRDYADYENLRLKMGRWLNTQ